MKLHRLTITNFRGIKSMSWQPTADLTCLIGPGDTTKTTILEALGLVLSTRATINLSDADFHQCNIEEPLVIEAVLKDLPPELIAMSALGGHVSGINAAGELKTDPEEGDEKALVVRLRSDETLEPIWEVIKPGQEDLPAKHLTVSMRALFGVFRVDERVDTHLRWGRGSALAAITTGASGAASTTVQAQRAARKAVFDSKEPSLVAAAASVKTASLTFGAQNFTDLRVGLDPQALNTGFGLVLHDGEVPLTASGLGSRRLTSLGIQEAHKVNANLLLIDEVETGLEPHRLQHLLHLLKERSAKGTQVIMTTHAPLVVEGLSPSNLAVVRSHEGVTIVLTVPDELTDVNSDGVQQLVRTGPSAMLASQVLTVEGTTEMGVTRALCFEWDKVRISADKPPVAVVGTAIRNGNGDAQALKVATSFAELGYPAGALIDSDNELATQETAARSAGVKVLRWGNDLHIEGRITNDLPQAKLVEFMNATIGEDPDGTQKAARLCAVQAKLPAGTPTLTEVDPLKWVSSILNLATIRIALGNAANKGSWFKNEGCGMELGGLLWSVWSDVQDKPLGKKLQEVHDFIYAVGADDAESDAQDATRP